MKRFLEKLASATPTPGGGSASALAGALSASLIVMAAGLFSKKDKKSQKNMEEIKKKALAIQRRLTLAVDEDARLYDAVIKAFRLPRETDRDRLRRVRAIQKTYQNATRIPRLVCEQSIQLMKYSQFLILKGNPNAVSDTGAAAFLADAALAGGLLNIGINLVPVTEKVFIKKMRSLVRDLVKERNDLMRKILRSLTHMG